VESASGFVETTGGEGFDRVSRPAHDCSDVGELIEVGEDIVRDRPAVAPLRPADADAQAQEVLSSERLRDRAQAVVTRKTAAEADLEPAHREVDVVVDDEERAGIDLEEARGRPDRPTRLVH